MRIRSEEKFARLVRIPRCLALTGSLIASIPLKDTTHWCNLVSLLSFQIHFTVFFLVDTRYLCVENLVVFRHVVKVRVPNILEYADAHSLAGNLPSDRQS